MVSDARRRRVVIALAAYGLAALAARAIVAGGLLDDHVLEAADPQLAARLDLSFRACRGAWVGRDLAHALGPLQALAGCAGGGSPAGAQVAHLLVTAALAFGALAAVLGLGVRPSARAVCLAVLAPFALWSLDGAARALPLVVVVLLTAPLEAPPDRRRAWVRSAASAGVLVAAQLWSFDVGLMGLAALVVASLTELLARGWRREPTRPALERLGRALACVAAAQVLLAAVAAAAGASWLRWVGEQLALLGRGALPGTGSPAAPGGAIALAGLAGLLTVVLCSRRRGDATLAAWLAGSLPPLAFGLARLDGAYQFEGVVPVAVTLVLLAARGERERPLGVPVAAGVLAAVVAFAWVGAHARALWSWGPPTLVEAASVLVGDRAPDLAYAGDLARVRELTAGLPPGACVATGRELEIVHPAAPIEGATDALPGSGPGDCPVRLERQRSLDDLPAVEASALLVAARDHAPLRRVGPTTWALARRGVPVPVRQRAVEVPEAGRPRAVGVPGAVTLPLSPPVAEDRLLRLEYTLGVASWRWPLGRLPALQVELSSADGSTLGTTAIAAVPGRASAVVAVSPAAAEARWLAGREIEPAREAVALALRLAPRSRFAPAQVALTVHSVTALAPGAPPVTTDAACDDVADLVARARAGQALPRGVTPGFDPDGRMFLHPRPVGERLGEIAFELRPCAAVALMGRMALAPEVTAGDGVDARFEIVDGASRTVALELGLEPGEATEGFAISLGPWADRDVLLRVVVDARGSSDFDWAWIERLVVAPRPERTFADALRAGDAVVEGGAPRVHGDDVFLHPVEGEPPAAVALAVVPQPDSCFLTSLRVTSERGAGDGVLFAAAVRGADGREELLFRQLVAAGTEAHVDAVPLSPWAGSRVELRLSTRGGPTLDYDWSAFVGPRIARCPRRPRL